MNYVIKSSLSIKGSSLDIHKHKDVNMNKCWWLRIAKLMRTKHLDGFVQKTMMINCPDPTGEKLFFWCSLQRQLWLHTLWNLNSHNYNHNAYHLIPKFLKNASLTDVMTGKYRLSFSASCSVRKEGGRRMTPTLCRIALKRKQRILNLRHRCLV